MSSEPQSRIVEEGTIIQDGYIHAYHLVDGTEHLAKFNEEEISFEVKASKFCSDSNDGKIREIYKFGPVAVPVLSEQQSDQVVASSHNTPVAQTSSTLGSFIRAPNIVREWSNPRQLIVEESQDVFLPESNYRMDTNSGDFGNMDPQLQIWAKDWTEHDKAHNIGYFLHQVVQSPGNAKYGHLPSDVWHFMRTDVKDTDQATTDFTETYHVAQHYIDGVAQEEDLTVQEVKSLEKEYKAIKPDSVVVIQTCDPEDPK